MVVTRSQRWHLHHLAVVTPTAATLVIPAVTLAATLEAVVTPEAETTAVEAVATPTTADSQREANSGDEL